MRRNGVAHRTPARQPLFRLLAVRSQISSFPAARNDLQQGTPGTDIKERESNMFSGRG